MQVGPTHGGFGVLLVNLNFTLSPWGLPLWLSWERIHLQCGRPGFNPWVGKIPLENGKATHCSILAWRIPRTVPSMGSQSRTRLVDSQFHLAHGEPRAFTGFQQRTHMVRVAF